MSNGQTPAHDRVCLIVDPPTQPIPLAEFLAMHREQGTAMTAVLLGVGKQSVRERARGAPWRKRRGTYKPTPRATPEAKLRARLFAIALRITALEIRLGLVEVSGG